MKIIGAGRNKVDLTHINNVVDAHLLAEGALLSGSAAPFSTPHLEPGRPRPGRKRTGSSALQPTPVAARISSPTASPWSSGIGSTRSFAASVSPEITNRMCPLPVAYAAGGVLEGLCERAVRPKPASHR